MKDIEVDKVHRLYEFISKLVFKASIAGLFTDDAADDSALYDAFMVFDSHLPLAMGGYKVDYTTKPREARDILLDACKKYRSSDNSEIISKRWGYFDQLQQDGIISSHDSAAFQLAMLWASAGNSMATAFWTVYYLLRDNDRLLEVTQEIVKAYSDDDSSGAGGGDYMTPLSQLQLDTLLLTDACITEALRLASGSFLMRHVSAATTVTMASGKTYRFRKGDRVGVCPPLWHMDEDIFTDPHSFIPSRWLGGASKEERVMGSVGKMPLSKNGKPLPR